MRQTLRLTVLSLAILSCAVAATAQLDSSFGIGGRMERTLPGTQGTIQAFVLPDGKIIVVTANSSPSGPVYALVRYNSDGTLDTGYGVNGEAAIPINFQSTCCASRTLFDAIRQPDGKFILVGGDGDGLVVRVNADGTMDNSFSGDGVDRPNADPNSGLEHIIAAFHQPDGKIVVVGRSAPSKIYLMRYDSSGAPDATFGTQGGYIVHTINWQSSIVAGRQSDGKIVISAGALQGNQYRFNTNGTLDNSFVSTPMSFEVVNRRMLVLFNNKILLADTYDDFTDIYGRNQKNVRLRRLNADGSPDTGFGTGGTLVIDVSDKMPDRLMCLLERPDGSVVIAAQTDIDGNRSPFRGGYIGLVQVDSDGDIIGRSLSTTRQASISNNSDNASLVMQLDGKLIIATDTEPGLDVNNRYDVLLTRHLGVPLTTYRFQAVPFDFGDNINSPATGRSRHGVYRPGAPFGTAFIGGFASIANFGQPGDIMTFSDFTNDFKPEVGYFRPSTGTWYVSRSIYWVTPNFWTVRWGSAGDIPVPADYDGDGKSDYAVFRPSDGTWYIRHGNESVTIQRWGTNGDKPAPGDYDGDGIIDIGVWRPSTGVWYVLRSSDGQPMINTFGFDGDIPIQEDYDGDGKTDIGVWRPSTGVWYIWRSSDAGFTIMKWGLQGDVPTPGDYDGDGKIDISVWRNGIWYHFLSATQTVSQLGYGTTGDIPFPGRY